MGRYDNQRFRDAPELIAICTHCKHADCIGTCQEFRDKMNELLGIKEAKKPREKMTRKGTGRAIYIEAFGEIHSIREWADRFGMNAYTLYKRICVRGMSLEEAVSAPVVRGHRPAERLEVNGLCLTVSEWAKKLGLRKEIIYQRLQAGWTAREALFGREMKH